MTISFRGSPSLAPPTLLTLWCLLASASAHSAVNLQQKLVHTNSLHNLPTINTSTTSSDSRENRPSEVKIDYETHFFDQLVDHFSWSHVKTFKQRYLVNKQHWCGKNCPILFYTGNEGDIEMFANNTGFMWENAGRLSAMLVFAEHRYYGQSMPFPDIDPTVISPKQAHKLRFLSSEQALADFARLIFALKNKLYDAKQSPVIALGGSYGGMLSAWLRMKYPQTIVGALAGSAPTMQFANTKYDCAAFNQIVTKDFEGYSTNCSKSIAESWRVMRAFANSSSGQSALRAAFNLCPASKLDIETLISLLTDIWVNMAMTDYASKASFLSVMPEYPIKHACGFLAEDPLQLEPRVLVERISKASQIFTNYTGKLTCLDLEEKTHDPMEVMWDFQSCTEMVMPICSDGINDMFEPQPFDVKTFVKGCKQTWNVTTQVNKVAIEYGLDENLPSASNIIFSYCTRDPWSAGSPQLSIPEREVHAIRIEGVCHHEDLRASSPNDQQPVKEARELEINIISNWIGKHYEVLRSKLGNDLLEPTIVATVDSSQQQTNYSNANNSSSDEASNDVDSIIIEAL